MSKTKTENLNKIFIEFANDILSVYPKYSDKINKQISRVKDNMETKYYLEYYLRHVFPNIEDISVCNEDECIKNNFSVIHGIKFSDIWNNDLPIASKHAIWRYLHTLYLLSSNHPKLNKIIEKYKEHENYEKIKKILENNDNIVKNIMDCSSKFAEEILKDKSNDKDSSKEGGNFFNNFDEDKFEKSFLNSNIGNLAKEISEEINPEELENLQNPGDLLGSLLGGNTENNGLGNLFQKVGSKLQDKLSNGKLDENALFNEAQNMMSMINPDLKNMSGLMNMANLFSDSNK